MKKNLFILAAAGAIAMLAAGCSSLNTNRYGSQPVFRCELDLLPHLAIRDQRVSGYSECTVYLGFIRVGDLNKQVHGISFTSGRSLFGGGTNAYQRAALYDACTKSKADMLIAAQYTIVTEGFFEKKIKCTVTGFPANLLKVSVKPPVTSCCGEHRKPAVPGE